MGRWVGEAKVPQNSIKNFLRSPCAHCRNTCTHDNRRRETRPKCPLDILNIVSKLPARPHPTHETFNKNTVSVTLGLLNRAGWDCSFFCGFWGTGLRGAAPENPARETEFPWTLPFAAALLEWGTAGKSADLSRWRIWRDRSSFCSMIFQKWRTGGERRPPPRKLRPLKARQQLDQNSVLRKGRWVGWVC